MKKCKLPNGPAHVGEFRATQHFVAVKGGTKELRHFLFDALWVGYEPTHTLSHCYFPTWAGAVARLGSHWFF
jgi:hypothetical protein